MAGMMSGMMSWYCSPAAGDWTAPSARSDAYAFHRSLPGYAPTPLVPVPAIAAELGVGRVLVTATDGNHGRAVARMAAVFGVEATVFVPAVMLPQAAARIAEEGAQVVWVDGDYDTAVRRA